MNTDSDVVFMKYCGNSSIIEQVTNSHISAGRRKKKMDEKGG